MHITQWGEYGVHCCAFMALRHKAGQGTVNATEIATAQGIDPLYAQQILQRLRRASIIESVRGPQGGYKLSKDSKEITLYDILVAAEGDTFEVICDVKPINTDRCSPEAPCNLRGVWRDLKDHVNTFLKSHTLETLLVSPLASEAPVQIGKVVSQLAQ